MLRWLRGAALGGLSVRYSAMLRGRARVGRAETARREAPGGPDWRSQMELNEAGLTEHMNCWKMTRRPELTRVGAALIL